MPLKRLLVALTVMAVFPAGCGKQTKTGASTAPGPTPTPQKVPGPKVGVSLLAPRNGATIGPAVTARVKLLNFKLDPKDVGKAAAPGKGHLHFMLDGGKFDFPQYSGPNGVLAKKLGVEGKYSPSVTPTITYRKLPAGKHTLVVQLANNDHSYAGAQAKTSFTVKSAKSVAAKPKYKPGQLCSPKRAALYRAAHLKCVKKAGKYRLTR